MPVFQETSSSARDLRILPSRALPLPRLSQQPDCTNTSEERREIVVIGVSELVAERKWSVTYVLTGRAKWAVSDLAPGQIWLKRLLTPLFGL